MKKLLTLLLASACYVTMSAQVPDDWYHQDPADGYNGVSIDKTYNTLLKGRASQTIVVAIIDSGMDIEHLPARAPLFKNVLCSPTPPALRRATVRGPGRAWIS